ncbi:hypothetical protein [Oculatella sp. LEGE 06141]|uniref:hypothetical protein n=1 Tax=Oculatella sp. LEGE 06141 TaxID=1828648 RepID=UPI0030DD5DB0
MNQEARGRFARFFRRIGQTIGDLYRTLSGTRNVFGSQRSGPSYIPSETFSVALMQQLEIDALSQKFSEWTIRQFGEEKLILVQDILDALRYSLGDESLLENELAALKRSLNTIVNDFMRGRTSLSSSIDLATQQLVGFIDNTELSLSDNHHCQTIIRQRLPYLRQALSVRSLEPTIVEVLSLVISQSDLRNLPLDIAEMVARIRQNNLAIPPQLIRNLLALAEQAQAKATGLDDGVRHLEHEFATWFDRSMERASGVYRRNAKGIGIIIGFLIAAGTNSDTFHIVNRLSRDSAIRSSITQAANQAIADSTQVLAPARPPGALPDTASPLSPSEQTATTRSLQTDLETVRDAVDGTLETLPLPLGWNAINLEQQRVEGIGWGIPFLRQVLGWFITGIALSMGASFWYDLLGKVVKVRNTGKVERQND